MSQTKGARKKKNSLFTHAGRTGGNEGKRKCEWDRDRSCVACHWAGNKNEQPHATWGKKKDAFWSILLEKNADQRGERKSAVFLLQGKNKISALRRGEPFRCDEGEVAEQKRGRKSGRYSVPKESNEVERKKGSDHLCLCARGR